MQTLALVITLEPSRVSLKEELTPRRGDISGER
jgi:hypothetical protein